MVNTRIWFNMFNSCCLWAV